MSCNKSHLHGHFSLLFFFEAVVDVKQMAICSLEIEPNRHNFWRSMYGTDGTFSNQSPMSAVNDIDK